MPVLMICLMIVNLQITDGVYGVFLLGQFLFYIIAAFGLIAERMNIRIPGVAKVPYFFCLINAASLVGLIKALSGLSEMNWVKTARD